MQPTADPLWYKDAIIYELHVRAFHDSDGDGYGDFRGLTQKVDYLEDLGVTVIWLLPFYPSPLKDDGYDIADYTDVHHRYGRLDDFKEFLAEAHKRNIRVITELVVNHTSDQHPWFQRARRAEPGSPERDFYVWSDSPEKYKDARIIFKDFEPSNWSWDPVAKQYYWHRFYSHQPDLNFDNPAVWQALFPILDFWMDLGVDGMRLDAIPYLFEREGTNCENLPETHEFLKALRRHADAKFPGRMFLAEANQWPEDAVAYFGNGDECHMAFHFPVMPRLFMALHQEDRFPILDILAQTPAIPETCQWCMFLRNHDELTLEMVTDEERDYMYRAYATDRTARINLGIRHRLAPLLRSDRRRIELMNALLASLPGTPVIYYGDEIGMGDNIYLGDRNGVRTPMQWSADRNAGFSRANPQKLYLPIIIDPEYHFEAINVEAQQSNPNSLLWWMKRLIALRKRHKAFGRGSIEFLRPENPKVLAFIRSYEGEHVLMVANLSRFVQYAELDLKTFRGLVPQELFGRSQFPPIHDGPYSLTIGPHGFYWFALTAAPATPLVVAAGPSAEQLPALPGDTPWAERLRGFGRDDVEALLPDYLRRRQFFRPEAVVTGATITDAFPIRVGERDIHLLVIRADFRAGMPETIVLATTRVAEGEADQLLAPLGQVGFVRIEGPQPGVICDALFVPECCTAMLKSIESGRTSRVGDAELAARPLPGLAKVAPAAPDEGPPVVRRGERHNVTLIFGNRLLLKVYRRLEEGISPELEVGRFLTERQQYRGAAPVVGYSEIRRRQHEPATTGVLYEYVPNQGDAWQYTLDQLSSFFERVAALPKENPPVPPDIAPLIGAADHIEQGERWQELFGGYGEAVRLMAQRTAEMHRALAADRADPVFAPESFTRLHQRSLYQSLRNLVGRLCSRLARERHGLPEPARELSGQLLARQEDLMQRFKSVLDRSITGYHIRCHGNLHLAQLLYTGNSFVVIDFAGEVSRTLDERRLKRSPLRDVATMARSIEYVAAGALHGLAHRHGRPPGVVREEDRQALQPWVAAWSNRAAREFVVEYVSHIETAGLLPATEDGRRALLEALMLEKALQEIDSDMTYRPDWVVIPLRGALRLLG